MVLIVSAKGKAKNFNKKRLRKYWRLLEPADYAEKMIAHDQNRDIKK